MASPSSDADPIPEAAPVGKAAPSGSLNGDKPGYRIVPALTSRSGRLLRFAVSFGLLVFVLSRVPAARLLEIFSSASAPGLWAAAGVSLLIELVLAVRLKVVARVQHITVSLARAVQIDLAAKFYGLFAPGSNLSGSAIRAYKLARQPGDPLGSVASIVFDRLIATASLGAVGQAFWLLERPPDTISVGLVLAGTWFLPLVAYLMAARARGSGETSRRSTAWWEPAWWDRTKQAAARFRDMRRGPLLGIAAASGTVHLLGVLLYTMLAASLGIDISFVSMGWISTATTVVTMVPISASGLGLREGALIYFLGLYGVPPASAIALSLLYFVARFLLTGLLGGILEARGEGRHDARGG